MKTVILAGGLGTRLAEETEVRPKPMVEIGGRPILWHIMKHYSHHGFREFFLALGYKGDVIRRYFVDYAMFNTDLTIDVSASKVMLDGQPPAEPWLVRLMETGDATSTGGRLWRLRHKLEGESFFLTYGDGVSDVDLTQLLAFHREHGRIATVTAVHPPARFGSLELDGDVVTTFAEKPQAAEGWINGGFFVFEPGIFDYLQGDEDRLEYDALERVAADDQLRAFRHDRFWQCMDTLRDMRLLQDLWQSDSAPWKIWP